MISEGFSKVQRLLFGFVSSSRYHLDRNLHTSCEFDPTSEMEVPVRSGMSGVHDRMVLVTPRSRGYCTNQGVSLPISRRMDRLPHRVAMVLVDARIRSWLY